MKGGDNMKEHTILMSFLATLGAICGFLYGELNGLMIALLIVVACDYITGLLAAAVNHELNSKVGIRGILKKIMLFLVLAVCHILDVYVLGIPCDSEHAALMTLCEFLYIGNEGLSILENAGKLGVPFPPALMNALVQLKHAGEKESSSDSEK